MAFLASFSAFYWSFIYSLVSFSLVLALSYSTFNFSRVSLDLAIVTSLD